MLVLVVAMAVSVPPLYNDIVAKVQQFISSDVLVIDPGHGGIDGGAESADGVSEKDINLAIALHIKELAEMDGWKVVMTRDEDKGLYDREKGAIRSLKTQDLLKRKEIIKNADPTAVVSIHLNSFKQDTSVRGAQTFYPSGTGEQAIQDESKRLAELIQEQLVTGMADGTERVALGKRDVLLLKNPVAPIAIVECGFLSNPQDAKKLREQDYQRQLAKYIYEGIKKFSGKEAKSLPSTIDSRG